MCDLALVIEGSSFSFGKGFPLSAVVEPLLSGKTKFLAYGPFRFSKTCTHIKKVTSDIGPMDKITVFCKSAGAYKFFRDYHLLKLSLSVALNIAIVSIDPYYPFWKCSYKKPIFHDDTKPHNVRLWNLYQRTKYPMGALIHTEKPWIWSNSEVGGTHKTIISRPMAISIYKKALLWRKDNA